MEDAAPSVPGKARSQTPPALLAETPHSPFGSTRSTARAGRGRRSIFESTMSIYSFVVKRTRNAATDLLAAIRPATIAPST